MFEALLIVQRLALQEPKDVLDVYEGTVPPAVTFAILVGPPTETESEGNDK